MNPHKAGFASRASQTFSLSIVSLLVACPAFGQELVCPDPVKAQAELMVLPECPATPKPKPEPGQFDMEATVYDDAKACPNCKVPHVVLNNADNGTPYAYNPSSKPGEYKKCEMKQMCKVCFKPNEACLTEIYMGSGPPKGKLDFPVIWYKKNCATRTDLPKPVMDMCAYINRLVGKYQENRFNCFKNKNNACCAKMIATADAAAKSDAVVFGQCKSSVDKYLIDKNTDFERCLSIEAGTAGVVQVKDRFECSEKFKVSREKGKWAIDNYNKGAGSEANKRNHGCYYSYEKKSFASKGKTPDGKDCRKMRRWSLLLPSACDPGNYPGQFGLNCCSGDPYMAGALGSDCEIYFPKMSQPSPPGASAVAR